MSKTYKIKPLEWKREDNGDWYAMTPLKELGYYVFEAVDSDKYVLSCHDDDTMSYHNTIKESKQAAEANYIKAMEQGLEDVKL